MISHIHIGVTDFDRAYRFYAAVLPALGLVLKFCDRERPWAGWMKPDQPRPLFLVGAPFEGEHAPGNGQMTALLAPSRAVVDLAHQLALSYGGSDDGAPGLRPQYHPHYYGAYFRDPDGNKLQVCCHHEEAAPF